MYSFMPPFQMIFVGWSLQFIMVHQMTWLSQSLLSAVGDEKKNIFKEVAKMWKFP